MPTAPPPKRHPYDQWSPDARALDLVGDKWTLLIIRDLACGPKRFVELQRMLPGISTEQLRSRLNRMVADGILTRKRYREVPPRVDYELTTRAQALMPILRELARWGYQWAWSQPREGERVDVGAIFRLARGLQADEKLRGAIELTVTDGHREGGQLVYTLTIVDGQLEVAEEGDSAAECKVSGPQSAWVEALAPSLNGVSTSGLTISGRTELAQWLLDAIGAPSSEQEPERIANFA